MVSHLSPPHLEPKVPQKHLISKVSKPFGKGLPNPWLHPLRGKMDDEKNMTENEWGRVDTKLTFSNFETSVFQRVTLFGKVVVRSSWKFTNRLSQLFEL